MALTLGELAVSLGCELRGDPDTTVSRVASLTAAGDGDLSFLASSAYRRHLSGTRATAVLLADEDVADCPVACLIHPNPYAAYARAAQRLHPRRTHPAGVHPTAVIEDGATVHPDASVGPFAWVGAGAAIEAGARVGVGCVFGERSRLGEGSELVARVTVEHDVIIGRRCIVHPGAVLGADGFGIAQDQGAWVKVPQVGRVVIGDDVEIGANTTVDRGAIGDTVLEDDVRLDNLIQIAHNVTVGAHTAIAAQVGIAGSTRIGRGCMIGGQAGVGGHLSIADGVVLMGQAMVTRSIRNAGVYGSGVPAEEAGRWRRNVARFRQIERLDNRLRAVERLVNRGGADGASTGDTE